METAAAINLLMALFDRAIQWGVIVQQAHNEGRAVSEAEVDLFASQAMDSESGLKAAIEKAKLEGR